jgi:Glycosyl transferase family 2
LELFCDHGEAPVHVSIGILAWNEEDAIGAALESLFGQTLFAELHARGLRCEIVCVTNGCSDATPAIVARAFGEQARRHPHRDALSLRPFDIEERGKTHAWNLFVHTHSAREAPFLVLMDGDIILHGAETLWNMVSALAADPAAHVSTDTPRKDISFKPKRSILERISLATSTMSQAAEAQLTGQLYCIRAEVARNIYLPADLAACEDGFIKAMVCTDCLTRPAAPGRIVRARDASHIFEAYTSLGDVLRNQKRQMIGQTVLHVLDEYLRSRPLAERQALGATLKDLERRDPLWLKRRIGDHLRGTRRFWRLFPGILGFRFQRLTRLTGVKKVVYAPAALVGFSVTLVSCAMAYRFLKQGYTNYWPDTKSRRLDEVSPGGDREGSPLRSSAASTKS